MWTSNVTVSLLPMKKDLVVRFWNLPMISSTIYLKIIEFKFLCHFANGIWVTISILVTVLQLVYPVFVQVILNASMCSCQNVFFTFWTKLIFHCMKMLLSWKVFMIAQRCYSGLVSDCNHMILSGYAER